MRHDTSHPRGPLRGTSTIFLASAVAGALFVPYALTKGHLTSLVTGEGWHLPGLAPTGTANLLHVAETVPMALVAIGLLALHGRLPARDGLARSGLALTLAGVGLTVVAHLGEHLLPPVTVPALTGGENWFMWGYYLSWLVVYAGLGLYGVALHRSRATPVWLSRLFLFVPVTATTAAAVATAAGVFTVAGTFRVVLGLTWLVVGLRFWRVTSSGTRGSVPSTTDA